MARVRDNHLGVLQGKMGPSVFKVINGQTFAASVPRKRSKAKTELESATMTRMGLLSRFASAVCKINKLKEVWTIDFSDVFISSKHSESEPFQRIIAVNYSNAASNFLFPDANLSPSSGYGISVLNHVIESSNFKLGFDLNYSRLLQPDRECEFVLMIHLSHPLDKRSNKIKHNHKFIILKKSGKSSTLNNKDNSLSFPLNAQCERAINDFKKAMVFFSIITYKDKAPFVCANAEGFILKGTELHEADVKEYERIRSIKTQKQIKKEKALENPDFESVIL